MEQSPELIYATNISFFLYDMLETLDTLAVSEAHRIGLKENARIRALKAELRYAAKDLRRVTLKISEEEQSDFGQTVDGLLKLILLVCEKSEENPNALISAIKFLESMPSGNIINYKKFGI